ncbi:MAG: glutamate--cysteine ligase [Gammaproteobacteria bacterium]|nr:glutamate--cysteine ligase [Gammaproteobacteria bacterium]
MQLKLPTISPRILQESHLEMLSQHLTGMRFGLEKEGLRVDRETGKLAQTPHPKALGSALTHPHITTDYSEALLEFVTGIHASPQAAIQELEELHAFASTVLGNERIWPLSMPCQLPDSDADIPLAYYGESHIGRLKTVYRRGLGFRYGRQMQTIAGVHFNLSFSDDFWSWKATLDGHPDGTDSRLIRDNGYFQTIRNFRRIQWLIMLLTGSSPSVDESFRLLATDRFKVSGRTRLAEGATSLRMSDLGYQSAAQESINICFNHLDTYCNTLSRAVHHPWPTYEGLGLKDDHGFKQLNTAVLQIENEYYSSIRPKRVQQSGERPVRALINRGVEYLEVRAIDLNPFARNGISEHEASLITLLMTASALADSPLNSPEECVAINGINARASWAGRRLDQRFDDHSTFKQAGLQFLGSLDPVAEALNSAFQTESFTDALDDARLRLEGTCPLLSDEIEQAVLKDGHLEFGLARANQHHESWQTVAPTGDKLEALQQEARDSLAAEEKIEASNEGSFDAFVDAYINQP